ncbi:MAG: hypothetical protein GF344_01695 [Chitinivibrionales bacterium]|nr:hypothetical protein [Chitinivibrionales bacterium]MBD3355804.1 hypothetical protein [Chitinivibrionales bacterium]
MNGVSQTMIAQSTEAVNQVLQMATNAGIEQAEKLVKMNAEMNLATVPGLGESVNTYA